MSHSEAILSQKVAIIASTIAVQQLIALAIACAILRIHGKISVLKIWSEPFFVIFIEIVSILLVNIDTVFENLSLLGLINPSFLIDCCQNFIILD